MGRRGRRARTLHPGGAVPFVVDTSLEGNGNGGHEYGTTLTDAERWALVEYLRSL